MEEEQKLEEDSAFHLSMEERTVKARERRPETATLRAVQLTVSGPLTGPGAAAVKLAAEEPSIERGLVSDNKMEGNSAMESLQTREFATLRTVLLTATGQTGVHGEAAARLVEEEQKLELETAPNLCMEGRTVLDRKSTRSCVTLV